MQGGAQGARLLFDLLLLLGPESLPTAPLAAKAFSCKPKSIYTKLPLSETVHGSLFLDCKNKIR